MEPCSISAPRVAFFPDSFHEVNGVAHTSRNFQAYAQRHGLPFLCVRASLVRGSEQLIAETSGSLRTVELRRSRLAVRLEKDLWFDPLLWRYAEEVEREVREFAPDVIHITGPSELGFFGVWLAHRLGVKLAASWHTNVHEYAARRLRWLSSRIGRRAAGIERRVESGTLAAMMRLYRLADVLYAPNAELCEMLQRATRKPCHLMQRGVDTALFSPARRTRTDDGRLVLGYVGRLSVEKNVALLIRIERELEALGLPVRFLIIGHGSEEPLLRRELHSAEFTGVLRGEALARAYANMDLLVFPSHTDTFGNVVLEALASGVPAIVTPDGGPKFVVRNGITGAVVEDAGFASAIASIAQEKRLLDQMRQAARTHALACSWDAVFDQVYAGYGIPQLVTEIAGMQAFHSQI